LAAGALSGASFATPAQAQQPVPIPPTGQRPNIVVIMGDDIGIWNLGAYHRGMMAGRTPNLDKIAAEGMLFTDYYAEAIRHGEIAHVDRVEGPQETKHTTLDSDARRKPLVRRITGHHE